MNYVNQDIFPVYKVYADSTSTSKPYGVESTYQGDTETVWFATQDEQDRDYKQLIGEISRGEF